MPSNIATQVYREKQKKKKRKRVFLGGSFGYDFVLLGFVNFCGVDQQGFYHIVVQC